MKRAQSSEQKEQRRSAILDFARAALDRQDYRDIRLQDLAASAGLVKGTFYRYFPTKQDLFMSVYMEELDEWLDDWSGKLAAGKFEPRRLERIILESLEKRPRLLRLVGAFPGDLEPELSDGGLRDYKRFMLAHLRRSALALKPFGLGRKAVSFLISVFALIQGCTPMCFPASRVAEILRSEKDFDVFRFTFRELFAPLLNAVMASFFPGI